MEKGVHMKIKNVGNGKWTVDYAGYVNTEKMVDDFEQATVDDLKAAMEQEIREEREARLKEGYWILKKYYDCAIAILHHTESHEDDIVKEYAARRHSLMKQYYAICDDRKVAKKALEAVQEKANRDWYCEEYLSTDDDDDDESEV